MISKYFIFLNLPEIFVNVQNANFYNKNTLLENIYTKTTL